MFYHSSVGYGTTCTRTEGFIRRELQDRCINISFKTNWLLQILMEVFNFPPSLFSHRGLTLHPPRPAPPGGGPPPTPGAGRRRTSPHHTEEWKKMGGGGESFNHSSLLTTPVGGRVRIQRRRFRDVKTAETERGVFWWFVIIFFSRGRQNCEMQQFGSAKRIFYDHQIQCVRFIFHSCDIFFVCFALESFCFHTIKEAKHKLQSQLERS